MAFSSSQIRKLQRDVKNSDIRTREINGRELSYIEGWHAIGEANRIFGFDGWNRETTESRCILSRENRGEYNVIYIAKVRVTVRAEAEFVIREGFGTGDARAATAGEAHEKAIKTAETDATKRALATFGKPFGLSLYVTARQSNSKQRQPDILRRRTLQRLGPNGRYYVAPREHVQSAVSILDQLDGPVGTVKAEGISQSSQAQNGQESQSHTQQPAPSDVPTATTPINAAEPHLLIDRPRRRRDPSHLRFVANQPCLICSRTPSDAHHLRFAQPQAMSRKVSDEFTVPLCRTHHRQLHQAGNEVNWWMDLDVDPLPIAQDLWEQSKTKDGTLVQRKEVSDGQ